MNFVYFLFLSDEGPILEMLDYIYYSAYTAHYVYINNVLVVSGYYKYN